MSWIRPLRSTRSRKTSLPMSRRAITRPATLRLTSSAPPDSTASPSARTDATSTRSGKRLGAAMAVECSGRGELLTRPGDEVRRRADDALDLATLDALDGARRPAPGDSQDRHGALGDVAVRIEAERPEQAVLDAGGEHLLQH